MYASSADLKSKDRPILDLDWNYPTHGKHQAAGVLGPLGALASRFAVFEVGRQSGRDPRATFEMQRAGHGAAEMTATPAPPVETPKTMIGAPR